MFLVWAKWWIFHLHHCLSLYQFPYLPHKLFEDTNLKLILLTYSLKHSCILSPLTWPLGNLCYSPSITCALKNPAFLTFPLFFLLSWTDPIVLKLNHGTKGWGHDLKRMIFVFYDIKQSDEHFYHMFFLCSNKETDTKKVIEPFFKRRP